MVKKDHKLWAYIGAAALIVLITVFSVKWPDKDRILGPEFKSHVYNYDTYKLLSCDIIDGNPHVSFNPSNRFIDEFTFTYDEESGSYLMSETIHGEQMYLCITSEPALTLTDDPGAYGCRWNVIKIGNSMYYMIINGDQEYAIALANSLDAVLVPYDEDDTSAYVRFQ